MARTDRAHMVGSTLCPSPDRQLCTLRKGVGVTSPSTPSPFSCFGDRAHTSRLCDASPTGRTCRGPVGAATPAGAPGVPCRVDRSVSAPRSVAAAVLGRATGDPCPGQSSASALVPPAFAGRGCIADPRRRRGRTQSGRDPRRRHRAGAFPRGRKRRTSTGVVSGRLPGRLQY